MAPDCIDFVDEDDAGSILLGLIEHIADAACADTDEHLYKVRAGDCEEWNVRLARDSARKKCFTGARRTH